MRANPKRHNRVYILSFKHTYRPMRVSLVAQLFYKSQYNILAVQGENFAKKAITNRLRRLNFSGALIPLSK